MSTPDCEVDSVIVEAAEVHRVMKRAVAPKPRPRMPAARTAESEPAPDVGLKSDDELNDSATATDKPDESMPSTDAPVQPALSDSDDSNRATLRLGRRGGPETDKPRYMTLQILQQWFPESKDWLFCFQPQPGVEIQARLVRKSETTNKGIGYCLQCLPHKETQYQREKACSGNCCYAPTRFIRVHRKRSTVGSWRRSIRVRRPGINENATPFEQLPLVDDYVSLGAPAAPANVSSDEEETHASRSVSVVPVGTGPLSKVVGRKRTLVESSRSDASADVGSDDTTDEEGDTAVLSVRKATSAVSEADSTTRAVYRTAECLMSSR